jgi:hypothetical protein
MSLVLICLLGVALIVYSRYERQHPSATQPTVGTHWYAALALDVCGKQSSLAANPTSKATPGITTDGAGVITIAPTSKADAGANATLGRFVQTYRGLKLTSSELKLPGTTTYRNGGTCPAGTPDAHKRADVQVEAWSSNSASGAPVTVSDPSSLKLAEGQLITIAYLPPGSSVPQPGAAAITAMHDLMVPPTTTTTTAPVAGTTTTTTP